MPGPGPVASQINALRGIIYESVGQRATTAQLWESIRAGLGLPEQGPTGLARGLVNQIRHYAVESRNAGEALARGLALSERSGIDQGINARMVGQTEYSRPQAEQNLAPQWQVNFQMTMTGAGGERDTGWFTTMFRGALPPTVNQLQDAVQLDAEMMAGRYGKALESIGSLTILGV